MKLIFFCSLSLSILASARTDTNENKAPLKSLPNKAPENDAEESSEIRKREAGYSYNKPQTPFYLRRKPQRRPVPSSRPQSQYGPPNYPQAYHYQRPSNTFSTFQMTPMFTKNVQFANPSSVTSQNDVPFGTNTAFYLPPRNQKLPSYTQSNNFAPKQTHQSLIQIENDYQNPQISDATLFLTQNARAISQLYGAPAPNQDYAPLNDDPNSQTEQLENTQNQDFTSRSHENHERIQDSGKNGFIYQLQPALNSENPGEYAYATSDPGQGHEELKSEGLLGRPDVFGDSGPRFAYEFPVKTLIPDPASFPRYGGFAPSSFSGSDFGESSPEHFGILIPGFGDQKEVHPTFAGQTFESGFPTSVPIKPGHPSVSSIHPLTTQLRPFVSGNPIAAVYQSSVTNKPIEGARNFYYQTGLGMQELKHAALTNPWSYANTYTAGKRIGK